jgi:glucokinase
MTTPWTSEGKISVSNRTLTLQLLREEGPLSRAEIARRLHLSRPTASRIVDALERDGWIACSGKSQPTGGRLGELYSFREDAGFVLGLELGTREARAAIARLNGEMLTSVARSLELEEHERVLPQLRELVLQTLRRAEGHTPEPRVLAIGVAVPGVVHSAPVPGYVDAANVFRGLNHRPLQRELEQLFGIAVAMDNDVNLAAIGEHLCGCAQGYRNVVYLFVGRGIGAGLLLDGQLFRGSSGAAGEVGNMLIDRVHLYHESNPRGCLESYAGIDRLVVASQALGDASPSAEQTCERAFAGEFRACEEIHTMNEYLAAALINLVAVVDPEIIVLGGDLAELPHAEELFLEPLRELLARHTSGSVRLTLSQLQGDAALYGAIQAATGIAFHSVGNAHALTHRSLAARTIPQTRARPEAASPTVENYLPG